MRTSVYIAMSIDGFIAAPDHSLDWLNIVKADGEDYGYSRFMESVDGLILGRRTYDVVRTFTFWPYAGKRVLVLTHRPLTPIHDEQVITGSLRPVLENLRKDGAQRVYIDGGEVIRKAISEELVTDLTISLIPVILGDGIRLFTTLTNPCDLKLQEAKTFATGLVQLTYAMEKLKLTQK